MLSKILDRVSRVMPADFSLTVLVVAFVFDLFILQPLEAFSGWAKFFVDTMVLGTILLSIISVVGVRLASSLLIVLAVTSMALRAFRIAWPEIGVGLAQAGFALSVGAFLPGSCSDWCFAAVE